MVSFRGQKKLGPRPDRSLLGVYFKMSDEHPHPFYMGRPPPDRLSLLFGDQIVKHGDDRKYVRPPTQARVLWASSRVHNVSGGYYKNGIRGGSTPRFDPLITLLYTVFDRKVSPFVYLLLINDTPFTHQL